MSQITEDRSGITVNAVGVVSLNDGGIHCNTENLHSQLYEAVRRQRPAADYSGSFAAEVTLALRFLGEMEAVADEEL